MSFNLSMVSIQIISNNCPIDNGFGWSNQLHWAGRWKTGIGQLSMFYKIQSFFVTSLPREIYFSISFFIYILVFVHYIRMSFLWISSSFASKFPYAFPQFTLWRYLRDIGLYESITAKRKIYKHVKKFSFHIFSSK